MLVTKALTGRETNNGRTEAEAEMGCRLNIASANPEESSEKMFLSEVKMSRAFYSYFPHSPNVDSTGRMGPWERWLSRFTWIFVAVLFIISKACKIKRFTLVMDKGIIIYLDNII